MRANLHTQSRQARYLVSIFVVALSVLHPCGEMSAQTVATGDVAQLQQQLTLFQWLAVVSWVLLAAVLLLWWLWARKRNVVNAVHEESELSTAAEVKTETDAREREFMTRLVDIVHRQMKKDDLDLGIISSQMGLSSKQVQATVRRITGMSAMNYVMKIRMSHACRLLGTSGMAVAEVGEQCGFQSNAHFARTFKQYYGMTPTQYRRKSEIEQNNHQNIT